MKNSEGSGERTVVGKIAGVHGVSGTMLLLPLTDHPDRFLEMDELVLETPGKPARAFKVESLEPYGGKGTWFFKAAEVSDRETAESLRGSLVTVANSERVELGQDEYWIDDIVGLKVVEFGTGNTLGTVEEVMPTGSNDVYVIRLLSGKLLGLPALADVIRSVDLEGGVMAAEVPDGLDSQ
jgi:16S rRNA processing protein RimM